MTLVLGSQIFDQPIAISELGTAAVPAVKIGSLATGIFVGAGGLNLALAAGGGSRWAVGNNDWLGQGTTGVRLEWTGSSLTVPNVIPNRAVADIGVACDSAANGGAGRAALAANAVSVVLWDSVGLAFFGGTPVGKPIVTGSRGGNAALASFLTALDSLGLVTDSTTA